MNRTDRLLAILAELKTAHWQRAADLADLFAVSTRTIYRDMQELDEAGVPLLAVPGKGYRLHDGYFIPPLHFNHDEAVLLLLGSDFLATHFEVNYRAAARTAALKIEAVLPDDLHEEVQALRESLRLVPVNVFDNPAEQEALGVLRRALMTRRAVRFRTLDRPDGSLTLYPYGLLHRAEAWYLIGFDPARRRVHNVRLDRMTDPQLLEETYERPPGYRMAPHGEAEPRDVVVQVLFEPAVARWVQRAPGFYVEDMEKRADGLLVTLRVRREAEVLPWLLGWGASAHVLSPPTLQRRLVREAEKIAARYASEPALLV